jgi:hypothetical protein
LNVNYQLLVYDDGILLSKTWVSSR